MAGDGGAEMGSGERTEEVMRVQGWEVMDVQKWEVTMG